jgi:dynein heavy chain
LLKIHRETLGVLVTIEVHAKDVIEDLVHNNIRNVHDFEWLA